MTALRPHARWTPGRKRDVVLAVTGGVVTIDAAAAQVAVPIVEIRDWIRLYSAGGLEALSPNCRAARDLIPRSPIDAALRVRRALFGLGR